MKKIINTAGFIITIVIAITTLQAKDWPKWRGPHGTGVSFETGWNAKALQGVPEILWNANVGKGHTQVTVQSNYLYCMRNRMNITDQDTTFMDIVSCLDNRTGKEVWQYAYPCDDTGYPGPRTTPSWRDCIVPGGCFAPSVRPRVFAVSLIIRIAPT